MKTIENMIVDICVRAGIDSSLVDAGLTRGALPVSNPTGYLVSRTGPAVGALKEICEAFLIDARETNGKLRFIPRSRNGAFISQFSSGALFAGGVSQSQTITEFIPAGDYLFVFVSFQPGSWTPTVSNTPGAQTWNPVVVDSANGWGIWYAVAAADIPPGTVVTINNGSFITDQHYSWYVWHWPAPQNFQMQTFSGTGTTASGTLSGPGGDLTFSYQFSGSSCPWSLTMIEWDKNDPYTPNRAAALLHIADVANFGIQFPGVPITPTNWEQLFPNDNGLWSRVFIVSMSLSFIPEIELGIDKDKAKLVEQLAQENDLPQAVTVLYNDATLNYQQGKQLKGRNPRILTIETKNQKILSLPFTLTPDQARQIAEAHLYAEWENRTSFAINLWRALYLRLDAGDWIGFIYEGLPFVARILSSDVGRGAVVGIACVADDSRNYLSSAVGGTNVAFIGPVSRTMPPTILYLLDIPLLRDADADPGGTGFYAAMGSASPDWTSAALEVSTDDVDFALIDSSDGPVAFGGALTTLAAPVSPWDWDTVNSLTVQMQSGTLAGDTDANVLNGSNVLIVGNEIIQFATAVDNGGGSFTISRLLRGRRGTEWACGAHGSQETVIAPFAVGSILREQRPLSEIGALRYYRGVTSGDLVANAPDNDLTLVGNDLKPYAPCHIGGFLDANNNVVITWMRRTRLGWASLSQDPVPLSEQSEVYDIDILNGVGTVIRTISGVTVPTAIYLAAQIVTDFGSLPSGGVTVKVYQKSAQVGRGFAGTGVVPTPGGWPIPLPATSPQKTFHVNGT